MFFETNMPLINSHYYPTYKKTGRNLSSVLFSNIGRLAFGNIAETPYRSEESDLVDFQISIDKKKVPILFCI